MSGTSSPGAARPAVIRCPLCTALNRVDLARVASGPKCGECRRPLLLDRPITVTDQDFERVLAGTEIPVVVDFHADWCGPCKAMAPMLDDFAREQAGEVLVLKLDTDRNPVTPQRFGIRGIPTLIVFRQAQERARQVGLVPAEALAALVA